MRCIDIIASFELEINKIDDLLDKPVTDDSLYWLNQAINKFVKLRFNRDFVHHTSYEQNAKRTEDLIKLYKTISYNLLTEDKLSDSVTKPFYPDVPAVSKNEIEEIKPATYNEVFRTYPSDFMYPLSEIVQITDLEGNHPYETSVFECTTDNFMYRITNSLTDFHYKNFKARPLRIRTDAGCKLITDKQYKISKYILSYLRKPSILTLDDPKSEYTDFQDHILQEIIKIAAQMYIENKSDERYRTIINEVNTQE